MHVCCVDENSEQFHSKTIKRYKVLCNFVLFHVNTEMDCALRVEKYSYENECGEGKKL